MKRRTVYITAMCCVAMLLVPSARGTIPSPLPALTIQLIPANPTASETFEMNIGGTWPDKCIPSSIAVTVDAGPTMWIDLILSSVDEPNCSSVDCGTGPITWDLVSTSKGPFPAGLYQVYARVVDCNAVGAFELLPNRIQIGSGGGQQMGMGFARGQRVVLLQDDLVNGLRAGQSGTVVCCDSNDCSGSLLVSWDLWTQAKGDTANCFDPPVPVFPPNSATWVDPFLLMIGRPFNQCGTLQKGLEGCVSMEADDGNTYTIVASAELYADLNTPGGIEFGQYLRVRGLLDTTPPAGNVIAICPMLDGRIYHPIVSSCSPTPTGCCAGTLFPGDRVTLLVDNPVGPLGTLAPSLMAGAVGTVVCCQGPYGTGWVFVSWDNWTDGINAPMTCSSPVVPYVKGSGWWVQCDQVTPGSAGTGGFIVQVGSSTIHLQEDLTAPNPAQTLIGCTMVTVQTNFKAELSVEVTATSAADGTWTGTITPSIVDMGTIAVQICVRGENVDLTMLPPGPNQQLASVAVFAVPAP